MSNIKQMLTMVTVFGLINSAPVMGAEQLGQWVCFAHDFVKGHELGDPETDDCIQSYHKGAGRCLSHAKSAAMERCYSYSENKETCGINESLNCFTKN